jgi:hypothetical protein
MPAPDLSKLQTPMYTVEGGSFVRRNGDRYNNRPLYCNQINAAVLAGDRPLLRVGRGQYELGTLLIGIKRGETVKWLLDFDSVTARYNPGRFEWVVSDKAFEGLKLTLDVLPAAVGSGVAVKISADGVRPGDQLVWACGAALRLQGQAFLWQWDVTTGGRELLLQRTFNPADAAGNVVTLDGTTFRLASAGPEVSVTTGRSSTGGPLKVVDANAWRDPVKLLASTYPAPTPPAANPPTTAPVNAPMVIATENLTPGKPIYLWVVGMLPPPAPSTRPTAVTPPSPDEAGIEFLAPQTAFEDAERRFQEIRSHIEISTPDPLFDAAVAANLVVTDAIYRSGMFTHSGMRWGVPLVGWRSVFSSTTFGWHDRVKTNVRFLTANQTTESDKTKPEADAVLKLTRQSPNSRLFGKGRIRVFQPNHYDMQSQWFDQIIHNWRWTGDAELEAMLRPSLFLHLDWMDECFDPDGDGAYESYTNTWPTDNTWFSGGGTSEQTAYAFTGHRAAAEMARRAGDTARAKHHTAMVERIRAGFFKQMWATASGHPGAVREQLGHKRLREDPWLYAIFCPIDAGLLDPVQSLQALHYTEWALERVNLPYGGQLVWPSNWVPNIWSARELWPGDTYHLALAYYQTGLPDDAWNIFRGTFLHYLVHGPVPGDQGHGAGSTDFTDCASPFGRTVIEGLFGYRPDYPNALVTIAPQLPSDWNDASIRTRDFTLKVARAQGRTAYSITLARPAPLKVCIPINARNIKSVRIGGAPAKYELKPGFGQTIVEISVPSTGSAEVEVLHDGTHVPTATPKLAVNAGDTISLTRDGATMATLVDPQSALTLPAIEGTTVAARPGHKLVVADARVGETPQYLATKLAVRNPAIEAAEAARFVQTVPADAKFATVDMSPAFNGDIRTIFQQQYVSPRPDTVSLRVGIDGYASWQMSLDAKYKAPEISLDNLPKLAGPDGTIGALGVSFARPADGEGARNVAFASLWDNWPDVVEVPVNRSGDAVWLLVAGSTFPMQTRIANGVIILTYADGTTERLDLIPPLNFWSLCHYGRADYNLQRDGFTFNHTPPPQVQLGTNCRAMVLNLRLRPGVPLKSVKLEALSPEVVLGLMAVSIMNPR